MKCRECGVELTPDNVENFEENMKFWKENNIQGTCVRCYYFD